MRLRLAAVVLPGFFLLGCGSIPADVEGTFDRASEGTLVVGVAEHQPWTDIDDATGQVTGIEADLISGFADSINAEIHWESGPESVLAQDMKDGHIDILIGGLTTSSPWSSHLALTRAYTTLNSGDKMVMGVPLGENELLVELETHLAREYGEIQ